jgi:hypothetical protein
VGHPLAWAAVLVIVTACAPALREPLRTPDYLLLSATTGLILTDLGQTHDLARRPHTHRETNPLLGPHPTHARVNWVFTGALVGNLLVTRLSRAELRRVLWAVILGGELLAVNSNRVSGLKWVFRWR